MATRTLPQVTLDQCEQITGMTRNHAAHTIYTTRVLYHGIQNVPIGTCPGKHDTVVIATPADPFHGLDNDSDRDL